MRAYVSGATQPGGLGRIDGFGCVLWAEACAESLKVCGVKEVGESGLVFWGGSGFFFRRRERP